jgi:hypothetical protein
MKGLLGKKGHGINVLFIISLIILNSCHSWSLSVLPSHHSKRTTTSTTASTKTTAARRRPSLLILNSSTSNNIIITSSHNNNSTGTTTTNLFQVVAGPDTSTKPNYDDIHGPLGKLMDRLFMTVFRIQLAKHVGIDSKLPKVKKEKQKLQDSIIILRCVVWINFHLP